MEAQTSGQASGLRQNRLTVHRAGSDCMAERLTDTILNWIWDKSKKILK